MATAVISDLHLGKAAGHDLLRRPELRARLFERLAGADRLVLAGDIVELREGPLRRAMAVARPFFEELGRAFAGKPVTLLCGNHDHQLAAPLFEGLALDGSRARLGVQNTAPAAAGRGALATLAEWAGPAEITLAYPGVWVRDDVYVTHGHYMDWHNTMPTIEVLAIGVAQRVVEHRARTATTMTPGDYEAILAPVYGLAYSLAQSAPEDRQLAGGGLSARTWQRLNGGRGGLRSRIEGSLARRAAVPAAVGALNRLGLGPLEPRLDAVALRRAGLDSMRAVVAALGIEARHVVFGHTHRSGPWLERDETEGWDLPGGGRLWNSGSWIHEPAFLGTDALASPYFPGVIVWIPDGDGPPRPERLLEARDLTPRT